MSSQRPYQRPPWFVRSVMNPVLQFLVKRFGVGKDGLVILVVRGRTSGEPRRTPVNVLDLGGTRYLLAPRGETDWVRNLRANPQARLERRGWSQEIRATELPDAEKVPVLRGYVARWAGEVKGLIAVTDPKASDDAFARIAPNHPVFRIEAI